MDNNVENKVVHLRLDDIIPNRFQPREVFDENELEELADSIREHGVIQPIIVRPAGDKYELIAGERRTKASALAGFTTIPAIVRNMDDKESAKVSLLENLQRKNLSAIEEARTYERILDLDNMTQADLARTMGKSQPMIANKLRLLSLPEEVQNALIKNQISERHARSLLNVKNKEKQIEILEKIKAERMTVRELDAYIKNMNNVSNPIRNEESSLNNMQTSNNIEPSFFNNNFNNNQSYNNFNSPVGNFNNMGLNDYQSSVSNNMFNNMPNNFSNQFNNLPNDDSKDNNQNSYFDYNDFDKTSNNETFNNNYQMEENNFKPIHNENNSSLASMLDGNNNSLKENDFETSSDTKGLFISQIKENEMKTTENKFLPNFDNEPIDNNLGTFDNTFQESYSNVNTNNGNDFDNFNSNSSFNSNINNSVSDNFMSYQNNQGGLFNQPLNIVDVPSMHQEPSYNESTNYDVSIQQSNIENESDFSNSLDDKYKNILFAQPVPIETEENQSVEIDENSSVEASVNFQPEQSNSLENSNLNKDDNQYISLDPVRTIFSTQEAVLELKKTTDRIKKEGINLESEEINFDDYYQIIIKIKKELD